MRRVYVRYLLWVTMASLSAVGAVAALNIAINPFHAFAATSPLDEFNRYRGRRIALAEDMRRMNCGRLIVGSSRVGQGIDVDFSEWGGDTCKTALFGTSYPEYDRVVHYAMRNKRFKELYLFIDFLMFYQPTLYPVDFFDSRFNSDRPEAEYVLGNLIGLNATSCSLKTVTNYIRDQSPLQPLEDAIQDIGQYQMFRRPLISMAWTFESPDSARRFDPALVDQFAQTIRDCVEHLDRVHIVIAPYHATELETIRGVGQWEFIQQCKRRLARTVADPGLGGRVDLWDFTGYDRYATEPIPKDGDTGSRMQWFYESTHYTPALGRRVAAVLMGQLEGEGTFGVKLTPDNIDDHLAAIEAGREAYLALDPAAVKMVQDIIDQAGQTQRKTD